MAKSITTNSTEFQDFVSSLHDSEEWKGLEDRIEKGGLRDNTEEVKQFNNSAIAEALRDVEVSYGYEPFILDEDTKIELDASNNSVIITSPLNLYYDEKEQGGRQVICFGGVCQHESSSKGNLINATTIHRGALAKTMVYASDKGEVHLRAGIDDQLLADPVDLDLLDSNSYYRRVIPANSPIEMVVDNNPPDVNFDLENKVVLLKIREVAVGEFEYDKDQNGRVTKLRHWVMNNTVIANAGSDGVIQFGCFKEDGITFIKMEDTNDGSNSWITIYEDGSSDDFNYLRSGNSGKCEELMNHLKNKLKITNSNHD